MAENTILLECDTRIARPGQTVAGEALWDLQDDPETIQINLGWYTEGKGTRDEELVETIMVNNPGTIGKQTFSFVMPEGPLSCSGRLISFLWGIECSLKKGKDKAFRPLILTHGEAEIDISKTTYESEIKSLSVRPSR